MKIILFYNSASGTIKNSPEIIDRLNNKIKSKLREEDSFEPYDVVDHDEKEVLKNEINIEGDTRVFIAGGDGTISTVINKIIDFNLPIGVLPLGTFNNFSKSINLPQNSEEAIDELFDGKITKIDAAKVNGRTFLNNSSVGVYTKIVSIREESRLSFNLTKPAAMFLSLIKTIFLFPLIKVSLISDGIERKAKTPATVVSNNEYQFGIDSIGKKKSLSEGLLYLHVIRCKTRLCVIKIFLKAMINKLNEDKDFEMIASKNIELKIGKKEVDVSADGEIYKMTPPLKYEICPKQLKIIVPKHYE